MMRPKAVFNVREKFQRVVYLLVADNSSGPLSSCLCGINSRSSAFEASFQ
jgi:hypothetical protein